MARLIGRMCAIERDRRPSAREVCDELSHSVPRDMHHLIPRPKAAKGRDGAGANGRGGASASAPTRSDSYSYLRAEVVSLPTEKGANGGASASAPTRSDSYTYLRAEVVSRPAEKGKLPRPSSSSIPRPPSSSILDQLVRCASALRFFLVTSMPLGLLHSLCLRLLRAPLGHKASPCTCD